MQGEFVRRLNKAERLEEETGADYCEFLQYDIVKAWIAEARREFPKKTFVCEDNPNAYWESDINDWKKKWFGDE